jgi:DNA recombination protein RmuC
MDTTVLILTGAIAMVLMVLFFLRRQTDGVTPGPSVPKELYNTIVAQNEMLRVELSAKEQELRNALAQIAARDQTVHHLQETLQNQKGESEQLHARFKTEFENLANRLLEEKSQRFTEQNAKTCKVPKFKKYLKNL